MKTMYCPKCDYPLVQDKDQMFVTLTEHVMDPNQEEYPLRPTWVCNNPGCALSKESIFWDEDGSQYGWSNTLSYSDFHSAYPSFDRRMEVEVYHKGVKDKIELPAALMLWILKPVIQFEYKADEWGKVLERSWKLKWLKRDRGLSSGFNTYYLFPIPIIFRSLKELWKITHNENISGYDKECLKSEFAPIPNWDRRWWRHTELWLKKIIFRKWYLKFK